MTYPHSSKITIGESVSVIKIALDRHKIQLNDADYLIVFEHIRVTLSPFLARMSSRIETRVLNDSCIGLRKLKHVQKCSLDSFCWMFDLILVWKIYEQLQNHVNVTFFCSDTREVD